MSARDRDPELAEERAVKSKADWIMDMTVRDLIAEVGTVYAQVRNIAADRYLSDYVGYATIRVNLESLVEAIAVQEAHR